MNKDRLYLILATCGILLVSFVNGRGILFFYLSFVLLFYFASGAKGKHFISQFLKILPFSLILSFAYIVHAWLHNLPLLYYIELFNLRLFSIVFTLALFRRVADPVKALSFSRSLVYIFILTYSQAKSYMKTYRDFQLVRESRMIEEGGFKERIRFFRRMLEFFFLKSLEHSKAVSMALKARGFFIE